MKNKTLLTVFVVASAALVLSVVGYLMNRKSAPAETKTPTPVRSDSPANAAKPYVSPIAAEPAPASSPATLSLAAGNAKRYENTKYGFSLLMPKDYWYEEYGDDWGVGPVFSLSLEHPKLKPEEIQNPNGANTRSKFGQLMFVSVCDRSLKRGKCLVDGKIDGLTFDRQTSVTIGSLPAQKFDDRAYAVVTDTYEYEIMLNPALTDSLSEAEMKEMTQAFENVVKTIWFK